MQMRSCDVTYATCEANQTLRSKATLYAEVEESMEMSGCRVAQLLQMLAPLRSPIVGVEACDGG